MSRRTLRCALALLLVGILAATAFGVAAGQASRKDDIPALTKKLADCREDVKLDREAIDFAEHLYALAKQNKVVLLSNVGSPFIITFADLRDAYILQYVTGQITKAQLAARLHSAALTAAKTLKLLAQAIEKARDERDADQSRCAKLAEQLKNAQSGGGGGGGGGGGSGPVFHVQPLTSGDVTNTHKGELTIDAAGKEAHFKASSGAIWTSEYSWDVPSTITAGKSYTITIHDQITSVTPNQPLNDQMVARAPGFAEAIQAHWPDSPNATKTFTVPLSATQTGEFTIQVEFISSTVTYHYKK